MNRASDGSLKCPLWQVRIQLSGPASLLYLCNSNCSSKAGFISVSQVCGHLRHCKKRYLDNAESPNGQYIQQTEFTDDVQTQNFDNASETPLNEDEEAYDGINLLTALNF